MPGQVHAEQRGGEQELGGEVAVGDRVDRVGGRAGRSPVRGRRRAGSSGSDEPASAPDPSGETAARRSQSRIRSTSRGQRVHVREQVMGEQDGLGVLQVRHAGHRDVRVPLGLVDERRLEVGDRAHQPTRLVAQVQPQVGGDLVVAAAPGAQFAAERAEPLQQAAFERRVHVLVRDRRPELAGADGVREFVEGEQHPGRLVVGEQAGGVQHAGVRLRRAQVVGRQPPVEMDADRQRGELRGRAGGEPAAPEAPESRSPSRCELAVPAISQRRPPSRHCRALSSSSPARGLAAICSAPPSASAAASSSPNR